MILWFIPRSEAPSRATFTSCWLFMLKNHRLEPFFHPKFSLQSSYQNPGSVAATPVRCRDTAHPWARRPRYARTTFSSIIIKKPLASLLISEGHLLYELFNLPADCLLGLYIHYMTIIVDSIEDLVLLILLRPTCWVACAVCDVKLISTFSIGFQISKRKLKTRRSLSFSYNSEVSLHCCHCEQP